jgi:pimeloyl-ACP methyl ester carboxylesterase
MPGAQHHSPDGHLLFSEEAGLSVGPLVALIHGSLDRSAGMIRLSRQLHDVARVLRYDRRGYAKSWPHEGPFTVADQVEDLKHLLQGRSAVLVGHSYGGNVVLAAAQVLGDQITGVTTYETPLSWFDWWPGTTAGAIGVASHVDDAAEAFMIRLIGQERWNALPERTKNERRREGTALVGELAALRSLAPWEASSITTSVICGFGSKGSAHHADGARWLTDHISKASLKCIDGAGHNAYMTHSAEFARLLVQPHLEV